MMAINEGLLVCETEVRACQLSASTPETSRRPDSQGRKDTLEANFTLTAEASGFLDNDAELRSQGRQLTDGEELETLFVRQLKEIQVLARHKRLLLIFYKHQIPSLNEICSTLTQCLA